ncbi:hypothetical protein [Geodermatophilus sp. DF01_2]|nr:hypothetical protein [Geodermatophilus sp. DF01_2]
MAEADGERFRNVLDSSWTAHLSGRLPTSKADERHGIRLTRR